MRNRQKCVATDTWRSTILQKECLPALFLPLRHQTLEPATRAHSLMASRGVWQVFTQLCTELFLKILTSTVFTVTGLRLTTTLYIVQSKTISNDQELIQSDPISCPQNQYNKAPEWVLYFTGRRKTRW